MRFVGRHADLGRLTAALDRLSRSGAGQMLAVRGRRQVGKSRLVTEFVERSGLPYLYYTALKGGSPRQQMARLRQDVFDAKRPLPEATTLFATPPADWGDALRRIRLAAGAPCVVVLDEIPWAVEADPTTEGHLQVAWDRELERLPILLILIGSDLAMMQRLSAHDRPLFGRAAEMIVRPFDPGQCRLALGGDATAMAALDSYLVTGGYPRLIDEYARDGSLKAYAARGFADENSSLVLVAQRSLDAEFPPDAQARLVLRAIGAQPVGHPTFTNAAASLGDSDASAVKTALTRGLSVLERKGVVRIEQPFGAPGKTKTTRYRIVDPYLSLWMRFVEPHLADISRGRADLALDGFSTSWQTWRGVAIEAVVRDSIARLSPGQPLLAGVDQVDGWWNRNNNPEVDIVAGRPPGDVRAVGSIKWRERGQMTRREIAALAASRSAMHAREALLLTVCPAGLARGISSDLHVTPDDLLDAWR